MQLKSDNLYTYISTATTTQVVTGAATLVSIIVGTTSIGTIGIIDGTTGVTVNMNELAASITPGTYTFNVKCAQGIRIVTGGASKITVVYEK